MGNGLHIGLAALQCACIRPHGCADGRPLRALLSFLLHIASRGWCAWKLLDCHALHVWFFDWHVLVHAYGVFGMR